MDDRPETISTADLLLAVLVALFGQKTVSVKMWRGRGNTDPRVPAGYFATDRLGKHPDAPVNRMCAERVVEMAGIALRGESGYDRFATSRQIGRLIHDLFGVATGEFVMADGDPGGAIAPKADAQLALLGHVMSAAVDRRDVGVRRTATALRRVAGRRGDGDAGAYGRPCCCRRCSDADCGEGAVCCSGAAACGERGPRNQFPPLSPAMTRGAGPDSLSSKGFSDDEEVMGLDEILECLLAGVDPPPDVSGDGYFCVEVACEDPMEWAAAAGLRGRWADWDEGRRCCAAVGPTGTKAAGAGGCGAGRRDTGAPWEAGFGRCLPGRFPLLRGAGRPLLGFGFSFVAAHGLLEGLGGLALAVHVHVGVDVHGDGAVCVARELLHDLGVHAGAC